MTTILVLLDPPEADAFRFAALEEMPGLDLIHCRPAEAAAVIDRADIVITLGPHLGAHAAALFAAASRLRWVQLVATGTDNVADHLDGSRVALTNAHGLHGTQMTEAALAAMLALARQVPRIIRNQDARRWERFPARLLHGKTVGIVGMGAIASAMAPVFNALGMRLIGVSAAPRPVAGFDRVVGRDALVETAATLDYLVLLAPYSASTHAMIDAAVLAALKPDAFLINLARGGIVDEAALLTALRERRLAGAALDVFAVEPLPADSVFWGLDNVIVTPHLGGFHAGYAADVEALTARNLALFLASGPDALINRITLPTADPRS